MRQPIRGLARGPSGLLTPVRNDTCLSWQHRAGCAQGKHQSSACTQCPQAQLPYRAWPCFSFPWCWSENVSSEGRLLASSLSYLRMGEGFLANQAPCTCSHLFLFLLLICSLSLAQESASSGKAGMSFLNCVYLLALGCESAPRQLHINLVSSLYLFSSASLPWPNLWLSFALLPIVTVTGSALLRVLRPRTGGRPVLIR